MAKSGNEVMADESYYKDPDFSTKFNAPVEEQEDINSSRQTIILDEPLNQTILSKKNQISIKIRSLHSHQILAEIKPDLFNSISVLKFSPSGRYIVVGNENC